PVTSVKLETVSEKISELPIIEKKKWSLLKMIAWLSSFVLAALIGYGGSSEFLSHITVFVLACFVGFMLVWNVSPALHTPLMSVTNAISGIIVIGGMIHLSGDQLIMPAIAVLIATINIVGGFMVTHRMLEMFRK
ncbi:MAG: proton-translocating transhydrogenase family protein, partial [SAR324 cluster bacterium]|nr:proton-translocating transhydrogenase family protein [SAR324 cluster bacterium]